MKHNIFITGGTGFVGFNLLRALVKNEEHTIYLLVRPSKDMTSKERIVDLIQKYCSVEAERILSQIIILDGEITQKYFGLGLQEYEMLSKKVQIIYHSAASIHFNLTYEEAKAINYEGTQNVLDFALECKGQGQFIKMNHISTAYISGDTSEMFMENDLDKGQSFCNSYEQTKFESEKLIREYMEKGLPITIFRPSIITADFESGQVFENNLIFIFVMQFAKQMYKEFVGDQSSSINIIPINYFVDAVLKISTQPSSIGSVYHIVNNQNTKIIDIVTYICEGLNISCPRFVPIKDLSESSRRTKKLLEFFVSYIRFSHIFDNKHTVKALEDTDISCPNIDRKYFEKIIMYGRRNGFLT